MIYTYYSKDFFTIWVYEEDTYRIIHLYQWISKYLLYLNLSRGYIQNYSHLYQGTWIFIILILADEKY